MNQNKVLRDERTEVIENASYRLAYQIVAFGALIVVAYRGFLYQQNLWDLMALVVVSSAVATLYQSGKKVLPPGWVRMAAILFAVSAILGVLMVFALR